MAQILAGSFPPGSPRAYIEAVLGQAKQIDDTEKATNGNTKNIAELNDVVVVIRDDLDANVIATQAAQSAADQAIDDAATAQQAAEDAQEDADQAIDDALAAGNLANAAQNDVTDLRTKVIYTNLMTAQSVLGAFQAASYYVAGVKVVGSRVTGFTAPSGASQKTGINANAVYPVSSAYTQAEVQAIAAGLVEARKTIAALQELVIAHGLGGV